jgi:hypothetical protein
MSMRTTGSSLALLFQQPPTQFMAHCEIVHVTSNQFFAAAFRTNKAAFNQGLSALARGEPPGDKGCSTRPLPKYTHAAIFPQISRHLLMPQPSIQADADAYVRAVRSHNAAIGPDGRPLPNFLIGVHLRAEFIGGSNPNFHTLWTEKGIGSCLHRMLDYASNKSGAPRERFRVYVASDRLELRKSAKADLGPLAAPELGTLMSHGLGGGRVSGMSFGAIRDGASIKVALTELLIMAQSDAMAVYNQASTFSSVAAAWAVGNHGQPHPHIHHQSTNPRHASSWFGAWQIHGCGRRHDSDWDPRLDAPGSLRVQQSGPFA